MMSFVKFNTYFWSDEVSCCSYGFYAASMFDLAVHSFVFFTNLHTERGASSGSICSGLGHEDGRAGKGSLHPVIGCPSIRSKAVNWGLGL